MNVVNFNTKLNIQKVQPETEAELTQVLQAAARALEKRGEPLWPLRTLEPAALRAAYPGAESYVGLQGGEAVAGMMVLTDDPLFWPDVRASESLFLHKLAVIPAFQGSGVASEMLNFAAARARTLQKRYLRLDCAAERPKLCAFYEQHGFRWVGKRTVEGFEAALYEREVRP